MPNVILKILNLIYFIYFLFYVCVCMVIYYDIENSV